MEDEEDDQCSHGKVNSRRGSQINLHRGEWCWPTQNRTNEWINGQHSITLQKTTKESRCLEGRTVQRDTGGAQWTWKKVTAENVLPGSMFPQLGIRQTEKSKNGKGFKGPGGEHIQNCGQQVMSVRTPEGFVRKSTCQFADVRRPRVSATHIIQAGNDLFIGKDEAYIMNRKREKKSVLREEGNVYGPAFFVKVPPGATSCHRANQVRAHGS